MLQRKKNYLCTLKKNEMKYQIFFLNTLLIFLICTFGSCKKPASDPENPNHIPTSVTDIDGYEYAIKRFGNTLWMMENLRVTRYDTESPRSGDTVTFATQNHSVDIEKPYYNVVGNFTEHPYTDKLTDQIRKSLGFLYNWSAAAGVTKNNASVSSNIQGICPNGWRLPTIKDFDSLCYYVDAKEATGKRLKSIDGWYTLSGAGTNESKMNCYPAGLAVDCYFTRVGMQTMYWSATSISNSQAGVLKLSFDIDGAELIYVNKIQANSVRCVKDL